MNLNIIGPINNLSYGIVTGNIVHALTLRGHRVALFPINKDLEAEPYLHESIQTSIQNAEMPNFKASCIRIWHQFDMSQWIGHGKHIGFPIFELDKFNDREKHHLRHGCHQLFVCSKWAKDVCMENKAYPYRNVSIVPLGVNSDIFFPSMLENRRRKTTVFLNVGKWEVRKGHQDLADIFSEAFNEEDDVELWMMSESLFLKKRSDITSDPNEETEEWWHRKYKSTKLGHKIRFIPRVGTQAEVADVMRQADCGVFPAKAEGWNLDLLEMMACGKRVIATNYSGHTEFCNKENTLLVDIDGVEPAFHKPWFHGQGNWSIPKRQLIIDYMRTIHEIKQTGMSLLNEAGLQTARHFSWDNTARAIEEAL